MGVCLNTLKTRIGRLPSNAKDSFEPVDSSIESMCKDSFELFFCRFYDGQNNNCIGFFFEVLRWLGGFHI